MSTNVFRAIVSYSSSSTGEIKVRIPAKFGPETTIDISRIGRTAYNGIWSVPEIGSQIVVTADDEAFTNVFWIQTNPNDATLQNIILSIEAINAQLASIQISKDVTIFEVLDIFS